MFSFFKKRPPASTPPEAVQAPPPPPPPPPAAGPAAERSWLDKLRSGIGVAPAPLPQQPEPPAEAVPPIVPTASSDTSEPLVVLEDTPAERDSWMTKLRNGLRKTGSSIAQVFTGTQIDDALYEELEAALLMADAGVKASEFLLEDLKRRVKEARVTEPAAVKALLGDAIAQLLAPLEKTLAIGDGAPTVMMVVGVNGAGKTTSIGKLTRHLADAGEKVLLAAADTFRPAAKEQLAVWAERTNVEIV